MVMASLGTAMPAIRELRVAQGELARIAVLEERRRFGRDLHAS
jgi:signal transduction histidine kinase